MLIDGEWVKAQTGSTLAVYDPSTGQQLASVPAGAAADVDRAVAAARRAFEGTDWRKFWPVDRERLLLRLADESKRRPTRASSSPKSIRRRHGHTAPNCHQA